MTGRTSSGPRTGLLTAWLALWAVVGLLLSAGVATHAMEGIPHVQDEIVYTWQAERLLEGRLTTATPVPRAAHTYHFLVDRNGERFGIFQNGWPAVLALGVLIGLPSLVNGILHGLMVLLGADIARRAGGDVGAFVCAPLLASSPQALLQGGSRMSHTLVAVLVLVVVRYAVDPAETSTLSRGAAIGGAIGWIVLTRPLDAVVAALVLLPFVYRRRPSASEAGVLVAILALAIGLTAVQNHVLTGDPVRFPQTLYFDEMPPPIAIEDNWAYGPGCNDLGFGADRGCFATHGSHGHTPWKAWLNAEKNLRLAGSLWLGSPLGLVLLLVGLTSASTRRITLVACALWGGLAFAYFFYWYDGACLGARFYHPALAPVVLACGLAAAELLRRLGANAAVALILAGPMVYRMSRVLPELHDTWGVDDRFHALQRSWTRGEALVLVAYRGEDRWLDATQTAGLETLTGPDLWRGSWFSATDGPLRFAEFYPLIIEATQAAHPDLPTYLYVMGARREQDVVVRLTDESIPPGQLDDLPLPTVMHAFPAAP